MNQFSKPYQLEQRTLEFSTQLVAFCRTVQLDVVSTPIISQLIRSGTSIGANYTEANGASSRKDFANKIFICKKEASETRYWLRALKADLKNGNSEIDGLIDECHQLVLIFQKIGMTTRENLKIETMKNK